MRPSEVKGQLERMENRLLQKEESVQGKKSVQVEFGKENKGYKASH